jgi:hypothetical protein
MKRREFVATLAGGAMAAAIPERATSAPTAPFRLRGVYFHDGFTFDPISHAPLHWNLADWEREIRWLHACGLNAVEFATMLEFNRIPSTPMEKQKIADRLKILDAAHRLGMQFGYLLTNTVLSTVPPNEEPGNQLGNRAETLCPRIPGNFEKTIAIPDFYMDTYREADFFEEFAADWGGCNCGQCGVPEYLRYVRALGERLAQVNPKATLYADTWCISFWSKEPLAQGWKGAFDREITGSREVIAALPGLPKNVGVALPSHHLYRPLAFTEYGGRSQTPAFPTQSDVRQVHGAKRKILAWPHFVMDDDAYRAPSWGIVHSEVRYLQALLQSLRRVGIDSVIGNLYLPLLQISNTFAYGRLLQNPEADPHTILADFARLIAHREDVDALTEILIWLENHSYWQQQMPPDGRLPDLSGTLNRAEAVRHAAAIRPNAKPSLPLPLSPALWLQDLRRSLQRMEWANA